MDKEVVSTMVTTLIADQMRTIIKIKGYMSESDFLRQALMEKIERERQ